MDIEEPKSSRKGSNKSPIPLKKSIRKTEKISYKKTVKF